MTATLTRPFEVRIVDRGLPAIEGLDLIARLRSRGVSTPIGATFELVLPAIEEPGPRKG